MPKAAHFHQVEQDTPTKEYSYDDQRWRSKPLTPHQILVNDIRLETLRPSRGPLLECHERSPQTLVPDTAAFTPSASLMRVSEATDNPIEKQKYTNLEEDFGWIRYLRSRKLQKMHSTTKMRRNADGSTARQSFRNTFEGSYGHFQTT